MKRILLIVYYFSLAIFSYGQMKMTSTEVNLRTTPEINNNKICSIPKGIVVSIVKDSIDHSNWIKINFKGIKGYVYSTYLINLPTNSRYYDYNNSTGQSVKYYKNSDGDKVQSPTYYNTVPIGASAVCNDGTYSFSRHRRGTCSHHGGVKKWL